MKTITPVFALLLLLTGCSDPNTSSKNGSPSPESKKNTWHKYAEGTDLNWSRPRHAGIAFDSKRQKLYIFGSDTHDTKPYNLDNSVYEFDLISKAWGRHYPSSSIESYRKNVQGRAIAGEKTLTPWAMHTFDNLLYDPLTDSLIVTATPTSPFKVTIH